MTRSYFGRITVDPLMMGQSLYSRNVDYDFACPEFDRQ
jgi:hypothetical protein